MWIDDHALLVDHRVTVDVIVGDRVYFNRRRQFRCHNDITITGNGRNFLAGCVGSHLARHGYNSRIGIAMPVNASAVAAAIVRAFISASIGEKGNSLST